MLSNFGLIKLICLPFNYKNSEQKLVIDIQKELDFKPSSLNCKKE